MGINSYYYDYDDDDQSDLSYSHINKTVKSFVLLSRGTNNNFSKENSVEENEVIEEKGMEKNQRNYFQEISKVESSFASCQSSKESLLL